MQIIIDPQAAQSLCHAWRFAGQRTALVPTMGYLHAGHASLIRKAREMGDKVIVSLFVNPSQFGPNEDLDAYPRDFERDSALARSLGVDLLFAPTPDVMYAPDHATWIEVPELAQNLCASDRPIHFRGVCTVVAKLFQLILPTFALFGEKDRQQLTILRRMARDLNMPVTIVGCPTVREEDGLALSSRNAYLTTEERAVAPRIHDGLQLAKRLLDEGEKDAAALEKAVRAYWEQTLPQGRVDYLSIVDAQNLQPLARVDGPAVIATAVRLGKTRLIDNITLR